jgi:V/A-type H+-transporting ATPase subunit C
MEYAYVNARIRAMKSRLLDRTQMEQLINKHDLDALIAELEKTPYREELERAGIQYSGIARIEVALRKDIVRAFRNLLNYTKGEESENLLAIILNRWDIQNIKTVLRGKRIHATPTEIFECLVPAGELDEAALTELVKQPDVKAVIDLLATWGIVYARPLTSSFKEYTDTRDMLVLEYALDTYYYQYALAILKGEETDDHRIIRDMIVTEIDVNNLRTVLRVIRDQVDREEARRYLLPGSSELNTERLLSMMKAGTIDGALKQLEQTTYRFLTQIPPEYVTAEKISAFEKELDRYIVKKGIDYFLGDPLSIAYAIAYIWAKYAEVTNIRVIARCLVSAVPEKELREALISV